MPQRLTLTEQIDRVVVVVLDGLRPDAISTYGLPNILRLAQNGASTFGATTVAPSVTAAAMGSLLTGASPMRHGLTCDRFHIPRPTGTIDPLARVLADAGFPSSGFMGHVPFLMRPLASRIASRLGFSLARYRGRTAHDVLGTAKPTLREQDRGLILMHWVDADRAGHADGWMSRRYADAAATLDTALGHLMRVIDLCDARTALVVLADHGGGGRQLRHHDSDHPLDRTIPVILAGGAIRPAQLGSDVSLLDVPATILAMLGIPQPASYGGRPLVAIRPRGTPEIPALIAA